MSENLLSPILIISTITVIVIQIEKNIKNLETEGSKIRMRLPLTVILLKKKLATIISMAISSKLSEIYGESSQPNCILGE